MVKWYPNVSLCRKAWQLIVIPVETYPLSSDILYIYRGVNTLCLRHHHPVTDALAVLPTLSEGAVMQEVIYCAGCRCVLLDDLEHRRMVRRHRALPVRMARVARDGHLTDPFREGADKPSESPLSLCGYPVRPGQCENTVAGRNERQWFLHFLIERRVMTKQELERLLTELIESSSHREGYEQVALQLQSDLRYVTNACIVPKKSAHIHVVRHWKHSSHII